MEVYFFCSGARVPATHFHAQVIFYYGLGFHHMAPNSILHLASFIMVCEAFLHYDLHFVLWLTIFGIKLKSSGSNLVGCGRAMINKNQGAKQFKGTFIKMVK